MGQDIITHFTNVMIWNLIEFDRYLCRRYNMTDYRHATRGWKNMCYVPKIYFSKVLWLSPDFEILLKEISKYC